MSGNSFLLFFFFCNIRKSILVLFFCYFFLLYYSWSLSKLTLFVIYSVRSCQSSMLRSSGIWSWPNELRYLLRTDIFVVTFFSCYPYNVSIMNQEAFICCGLFPIMENLEFATVVTLSLLIMKSQNRVSQTLLVFYATPSISFGKWVCGFGAFTIRGSTFLCCCLFIVGWVYIFIWLTDLSIECPSKLQLDRSPVQLSGTLTDILKHGSGLVDATGFTNVRPRLMYVLTSSRVSQIHVQCNWWHKDIIYIEEERTS